MTSPIPDPRGIREDDYRDAIAYTRALMSGDQTGAEVIMLNADVLRCWGATASLLVASLRYFLTPEQTDKILAYWLQTPPAWLAPPTGGQQ